VLPHREHVFEFSSAAPLNGIVAHLTRQCGGNVHNKGVIAVTAFKPLGSIQPSLVVDLDAASRESTYCSEWCPEDQWIALDFKNRTVIPKYYTLRTRVGGWVGNLNVWLIEGSMDGTNWQPLTEMTSSPDMNRPNLTLSFPITNPVESRCVRLHMSPTPGNWNIILSAFELFGILKQSV
jgi:hypothetical protein